MSTPEDQKFFIVVNFEVPADLDKREVVDETLPQTPEEINDKHPEVLSCQVTSQTDDKRRYAAVVAVKALSSTIASAEASSLFSHLPEVHFDRIEVFVPVEASVGQSDEGERIFHVWCLFSSPVAWMQLSRAFQTELTNRVGVKAGTLAPSPEEPQFMARIELTAEDDEDAKTRSREICAAVCGVTDDQASKVNFVEKECVVVN